MAHVRSIVDIRKLTYRISIMNVQLYDANVSHILPNMNQIKVLLGSIDLRSRK